MGSNRFKILKVINNEQEVIYENNIKPNFNYLVDNIINDLIKEQSEYMSTLYKEKINYNYYTNLKKLRYPDNIKRNNWIIE